MLIKSDLTIVGWVGSPALLGAALGFAKGHRDTPD
jgi:hypothetical protein